MSLPDLRFRMSATDAEARRALTRARQDVRDLGAEARRTSRSVENFSRRITTSTGRTRNMSLGVRNAAFQFQDLAVQIGSGQRASVALAQQLPQLLGGFGTLGAVLGVVVGVALPLRTAMQGLAADGQDVTKVFGTLQPVAQSISAAMETMKTAAVEFAELVVNNIDRILVIGATAATFFAGKWVAGMVAARIATFSLSASLVALRTALIRTGIGAAIVAAGELAYQFTRLVRAAGGFGEAVSLLGGVATETFGRIGAAFAVLKETFAVGALSFQRYFLASIANVLQAFQDMTWSVAQGLNNLFGTSLEGVRIGAIAGMGTGPLDRLISQTDLAIAGAGQRRSDAAGKLSAEMESITRIRDLLQSMKDEGLTLGNILGVGEDGEEGAGGKGKTPADQMEEQEKRITAVMDRLRALTKGTLADKLGAWGNYFSNLVSMTGSNNQRLLSLGKAFAASQALIDSWKAYTATLADPSFVGRPWARIAAAAQVLAAGIGAVNAIKSVGMGGSGGGAGGGAGSTAAAAAPNQPLEAIVRLQGPFASALAGEIGPIFDMLREEAGDRGLSPRVVGIA